MLICVGGSTRLILVDLGIRMAGTDQSPKTGLLQGDLPASKRRSKRSAVVAVIVVVILIVAALGGYEVYRATQPSGSPYPSPPSGWTTFDSALAAVQSAVVPTVSGPWNLSFVEGAAANGHWSPMAWQWAFGSVSSCGIDPHNLTGIGALTFWNASVYPVVSSANVFSSGAAPMWTFVFQNGSGIRIVATWFLGNVILNGIATPTNPQCRLPPDQPALPEVEMDSNAAAQLALQRGGSALVAGSGYHAVLYFAAGATMLDGYVGGGGIQPFWSVAYTQCGAPGYFGPSGVTEIQLNSTTGQWEDQTTMPGPCFDTSYSIGMTQGVSLNLSSPSGTYLSTTLTSIGFLTSAVPPVFNMSGLTTDLVNVTLFEGPNRNPVPPAAANCTPSHPGLANCTAPNVGWYAVLLDHQGHWLDSFPSDAGGRSWTVPGVPLVPGDEVVIVSASLPTEAVIVYLDSAQANPFVFGATYLENP